MKTYDLIILEGEELLLETIAIFDGVLLRQEGDDLICSLEELIAVAPYAISGVCCMTSSANVALGMAGHIYAPFAIVCGSFEFQAF